MRFRSTYRTITVMGIAATGLMLQGCSSDETEPPVTPIPATCGDGVVNGAEACDGTDLGGASCASEGFAGGSLSCSATCTLDTSACTSSMSTCGDGVIDTGEVCDGAELGGEDCTTQGFTTGTLACATSCASFDTAGCCTDACDIEGTTECQGDTLRTCTLGASGCLEFVETDCTATGDVCDDGATPAQCAPNCTDACSTDGATSCDGGNLETCADSDADGCLDITVTDCLMGGQICDSSQMPSACAANGTGDSCTDPFFVQTFPANFAGADFTADFANDDHDFDSGTDCEDVSTSGADAGIDAVFRVDLETGDRVFASDDGGIDFVMHFVAADQGSCLDTAACIESIDFDEDEGMVYEAQTDETVYVVFEKWSGSSTTNDYDITIDVTPAVCGDGVVNVGEMCDDGNAMAGDGCAADCLMVESGFDCNAEPSFCFPTGTGDVCGAVAGGPAIAIGPGSYAFDTTGFMNDYDDYNGACGTDQNGAGPDAIFEVMVPAGEILEVTNTDSVDFNGVVVISTDCNDIVGSCADWSDTPEEVAWYNDTASMTSVYFIIDGTSSTQEGVFAFEIGTRAPVCGDSVVDLGEACDDGNTAAGDGCAADCMMVEAGFDCNAEPSFCFPAGTGDVCGAVAGGPAISLGPGSYAFDTTGFTNDYDDYNGACGTDQSGAGPDAIFEVMVPAGDILEITNTDSVGFDGVVVISTDCNDILGSCADWSDISEEVSWYNDTAAMASVYFIIDGFSSSADGVFVFDLGLRTPVCGDSMVDPGETCDDGNTMAGDGCDDMCQIEFCPAGTTEFDYSSADTPLAIPDFTTAVGSVINVATVGTVAKAMVQIDSLTHGWASDIDMFLVAPDATIVELSTDNGSSSDNYIMTFFDQSCPTPITSGSAPFTGCYSPEGDLTTVNGQAAAGSWTLEVADDAQFISGTLNSWSLKLCIQ